MFPCLNLSKSEWFLFSSNYGQLWDIPEYVVVIDWSCCYSTENFLLVLGEASMGIHLHLSVHCTVVDKLLSITLQVRPIRPSRCGKQGHVKWHLLDIVTVLEVWLFSQLWSLCPVQMTGKKKKELVLSYFMILVFISIFVVWVKRFASLHQHH